MLLLCHIADNKVSDWLTNIIKQDKQHKMRSIVFWPRSHSQSDIYKNQDYIPNAPNQNWKMSEELCSVSCSEFRIIGPSLYNHLQVKGLFSGSCNLRPLSSLLASNNIGWSWFQYVCHCCCGQKQQLIILAVNRSKPPSTDQHATDGTAVYQWIRCDCVGGDECDRIWMWNINYDECRPRVICSVSAVTRVGGSRSHGNNKPSAVNTDEETELVFLSGIDIWMDGWKERWIDR